MDNAIAPAFPCADKIASAARELDWLKNLGNPIQAAEAQKHINTLHARAIHLAGPRAHELYAPDDEADQLELALAAGMACCSDEVTAGPGWSGLDTMVPA
ncbi:MAG: hypothetical protein WC825_02315 [Gallionellaceae bacterium]|jgi:hypothetical protein